MVEALIYFRVFFFIVILLALLLNADKVRIHLGRVVYYLGLSGMGLMAIAQLLQAMMEVNGQVHLRPILAVFFTLGLLLVSLAVIRSFIYGTGILRGRRALSERERWLSKVYENVPSGVFVLRRDELVYANDVFKSLSARFRDENPFSNCKEREQEVWLTSPNGQAYVYWVGRFPMQESEDEVVIVSDVTAIRLHQLFIENLGLELIHHGDASFNIIVNTLAQFNPDSLIYIGRYQEDSKKFTYVTHSGEEQEASIFSDLVLPIAQYPLNQWTWLNRVQILKQDFNNLVSQYAPDKLGIILFADEQDSPLGVLMLLQKEDQQLDPVINDFLSLISLRIRSEFEHARHQKLLRASGQRYNAFISRTQEAIVDVEIHPSIRVDDSLDEQWQLLLERADITTVNPAFRTLFSVNANASIEEVFLIKSIKHLMRYVMQSGFGEEIIEVPHDSDEGETKWLSCSVMSEIEDGRLYRFWIIIKDITESRRHIQDLEYQTRHDALTGLPNRAALRETLEDKIEQAHQFGFKVALLMVDLDRFKEINDALGHHYGDVLLKKMAPRLKPILQPRHAYLARLGGDEFAVVMPNLQSLVEAEELAREILSQIREPFDLGQLHVEISGSIGISVFPEDGTDTSTLMRCADVAMYKAKSVAGGVLCYRNEFDDHSPRRLAILASMGPGLKDQQFYLCFQPKVSVEEQAVTSAEALIRWQHPEMGMVSPGEFIPLAEMSDLIIAVTEWVIDETLSYIQAWLKQGLEVKVSVNVSTRNLLDENLIPYLQDRLKHYEVPAQLLELEITESALMADPDRALETLQKISQLGISISVDDFGTGYSSMEYLRRLPLDALKIDIAFVRNMCVNPQDEIIVNSIINLSHNLGLVVVAEGAEDQETIEKLSDMHCDFIQGYFYSPPLVAEKFVQFCVEFNQN